MKATEVPARELQKAKNQLLTQHYAQLKTIAGRASLLGNSEILYGNYDRAFSRDKEYDAVTAADIQRVAKQYFTEKNRTVGTLIPDKEAK